VIHINRNITEPDSIVNDADSEHLEAEAFYKVDREKFKAFNHKVFRQPDVKKALENQFNKKCAYCESKVTPTSNIDKEHFRPKGSIIDKEKSVSIKPGYYWLAAKWDNLLLACANCNRTGTFETIEGISFVSGKLDKFPLSDESKRYAKGGSLEEEEKVRLLINPCVDYPESWIDYDEIGMIYPRKGLSSHEREKVKTSIKTYGLYRNGLTSSRKEHLLVMQDYLQYIYDNYNDFLKGHDKEESLKRIKRGFISLKRIKAKDKEYLGIKRFYLGFELLELKKIISLL
jgi:uncharacterized protein (TIGR02646 family)